MMKVKLLAGVAIAGLFAAGVANAEPNGWYGAIDAGYHTIGTIEADGQRGPQFDIETQEDWAAFARLGYRFDQNWRVELEGGYRSTDIERSVGRLRRHSCDRSLRRAGRRDQRLLADAQCDL
jgi:opacity protein-like surface antigen